MIGYLIVLQILIIISECQGFLGPNRRGGGQQTGGIFDTFLGSFGGPTEAPFTDPFSGGFGMGNGMMAMLPFMAADIDYADQMSARADARAAQREAAQAARNEAANRPRSEGQATVNKPTVGQRQGWRNINNKFRQRNQFMRQWETPTTISPFGQGEQPETTPSPYNAYQGSENFQTQHHQRSENFQTRRHQGSENFQTRPSQGSERLQTRPSQGSERLQTRPSQGSERLQTRPSQGSERLQTRPNQESENFQAQQHQGKTKWIFRQTPLEPIAQSPKTDFKPTNPSTTPKSKRSLESVDTYSLNRQRLGKVLSTSNTQVFKDSTNNAAINQDFPLSTNRKTFDKNSSFRSDRIRPRKPVRMDPDLMSDMMDLAGDMGLAGMMMNTMSRRSGRCDLTSIRALMEYMITGKMCGVTTSNMRFGLGRR